MKKVVGIGFLVVAAAVLYFGLVGWPSLDVNIWALFPVGLFLFFTLENLVKKRLQGQSHELDYCLYHCKCYS